jgi:hypothetical protein
VEDNGAACSGKVNGFVLLEGLPNEKGKSGGTMVGDAPLGGGGSSGVGGGSGLVVV